MFIVYDLDDSLTDTRHRANLLPNWKAFYEACVDDPPYWETLKLLQLLMDQGHKVEVWTGRCQSVRKQTEEWFQKHIQTVPKLKMRPENYKGPNIELKRAWLLSSKMWPNLVFEDREDIAEMYRSYGVRVALLDSQSSEAAEKADRMVKEKRNEFK